MSNRTGPLSTQKLFGHVFRKRMLECTGTDTVVNGTILGGARADTVVKGAAAERTEPGSAISETGT